MSLPLGVCGRCFYNPIEFLELLSCTSIRVDEFWVSTGNFPRVSITYLTSCGGVFLGPGQILVLPSRYCLHVDKPRAFTSLFRCLCILVVWTSHPWILLRVAGTLVRADEAGFRICVRGAITSQLIGLQVLTLEKLFVLPSYIKSCGYFRTFLVNCCVNIPCDLLLEHSL